MGDSKRRLTRRRFLSLSAAGAAGLAVLGPTRMAAAPAHFDLLSVGYVEGSDVLTTLRRAPRPLTDRVARGQRVPPRVRPLTVVPADALAMGDPTLSLATVWMRVHGLHPALDTGLASLFRAVHLTVLFPTEDPQFGEYAATFPWGARGGRRPTAGQPTCFQVPLAVDGGLELVLDVLPTTGGTERYATSFTVDPVAGLPKLQRGIYLLGVTGGVWNRTRRVGRPAVQDLSLVVSFDPVLEA